MYDEILFFWGTWNSLLSETNIKCSPASCISCLVFIPIFRTGWMHGSKLSIVLLSHFMLYYVHILDVKWWRIKQYSTKKRHLLAILRKILNFEVLVLGHLWTDCLETSYRWFFWPYTTSKFWTVLHDGNLIFRGHMKHPRVCNYLLALFTNIQLMNGMG